MTKTKNKAERLTGCNAVVQMRMPRVVVSWAMTTPSAPTDIEAL